MRMKKEPKRKRDGETPKKRKNGDGKKESFQEGSARWFRVEAKLKAGGPESKNKK